MTADGPPGLDGLVRPPASDFPNVHIEWCDLYGCRIRLEVAPGEATTWTTWATGPAGRAGAVAEGGADVDESREAGVDALTRILLVEDDADSAAATARLLRV